MPQSNRAKKMLLDYGILAGSLGVLFLVLFSLTLAARGAQEQGLRAQTQGVLDRVYPGEYLVEGLVEGAAALEAANATALCFELKPKLGKDFSQQRLALIMTMGTIFGPLPGVFLIQAGEVSFAGFALYTESFAGIEGVLKNSQVPRLVKTMAAKISGGTNGQ
jgi:hypothetical protein